jgi:hypothetical protein
MVVNLLEIVCCILRNFVKFQICFQFFVIFGFPEETQEEQRMFFVPKLVGEDLVQVDGQNGPNDQMAEETDKHVMETPAIDHQVGVAPVKGEVADLGL